MTSRGQQGANKALSLPKAKLEERASVYSLPWKDRPGLFWQISTTSEYSPASQRHVCHQKRSPARLQNINPSCSEERMCWSCGPGGRCGERTYWRPDSGLLDTTALPNKLTLEHAGYAVTRFRHSFTQIQIVTRCFAQRLLTKMVT